MGNRSTIPPRTANSPAATTLDTAAYPASTRFSRSLSKSSVCPVFSQNVRPIRNDGGASRCMAVDTGANSTSAAPFFSCHSTESRSDTKS